MKSDATTSGAAKRDTAKPTFTIAIQPLGRVTPQIVEQVRRSIQAKYSARVQVLPAKRLSPSSLSSRAGSYRAEKILHEMNRNVHPSFTKVIALTEREISTTKGRHKDWSISGYGLLAQRPCVVSTYLIGRKKSSYPLFQKRLVKIANHELGHTFGLNHCPDEACLMADMKGTLRGLDRRTGSFCPGCHKRLRPYLRTS